MQPVKHLSDITGCAGCLGFSVIELPYSWEKQPKAKTVLFLRDSRGNVERALVLPAKQAKELF